MTFVLKGMGRKFEFDGGSIGSRWTRSDDVVCFGDAGKKHGVRLVSCAASIELELNFLL